MLHFLKKPIEQPWAYAHRQGFTNYAPGNYFYYFATRDEAEESRAKRIAKGKWCGEIENRPGESRIIGGL